MTKEWQVQRLVREWTQHGTLIIACDFDDTLCPFNLKEQQHLDWFEYLFAMLGACQVVGAHIILNTASAPGRWEEMRRYCEQRGLRIADVNKSLPGMRYGHHGKVYANIYLDDRAGIGEATTILNTALDQMLRNRNNNPS